MKDKINHINEYHELFGGSKRFQEIGNPFKAIINKHFDGSLIFAIVEMVNLNHKDIDGEGMTYIYSPFQTTDENKKIIDEYKTIIDKVKSEHTYPLSAYKKWYNLNTFLYFGENPNPEIKTPDNSTWRLEGHLQSTPKKKKDYGYIEKNDLTDEEYTEEYIIDYAREYLSVYLKYLETDLGFNKYPFYAVLVRSVSVRDKKETFHLGNLYLNFATSDKKDKDFYIRLINDFLFVWIKEHGGTIIKKFKEEADKEADSKVLTSLKEHYPAIWTDNCRLKFNKAEKEKIDEDFGNSNVRLSLFFDSIFTKSENYLLLKGKQDIILNDLLPCLLKIKEGLKSGVTSKPINSIWKEHLSPRAQHTVYTALDTENISEFIRILTGRDLINVCGCLFGFNMKEIHSLFTSSGSDYTNNNKLVEANLKRKIGPYISQYFVYSRHGKTCLTMDKNDLYLSASRKEKDFLLKCVNKVNLLIKDEYRENFNNISCAELQLNAPEVMKIKNNSVSRLDIFDFKQNWCNENKIIPELLKSKAEKYLRGPILDCGAGLGDIAYMAFPEKEAILIDVNPIVDNKTNISHLHKQIVTSFFDYYPEKQIKTVLISHTLQFIDDDIERLNRKIAEISPEYLITVVNENDDIMGELIEWTNNHYENANPEIKLSNFPEGYKLIETIPFQAEVKCPDFDKLAQQISYLMLIDLTETGEQLKNYLATKLKTPSFKFNQAIEVYSKNVN